MAALIYVLTMTSLFVLVTTGEVSIRSTVAATNTDVENLTPPSNLESWSSIMLDEPLTNKSRYAGDKLNWDCSITGNPVPRYSWLKDGQPIVITDRRVTINPTSWGSRIRFSVLELSDAGIYTCIGENVQGQRNTSAILTVRSLPIIPDDSEESENKLRHSGKAGRRSEEILNAQPIQQNKPIWHDDDEVEEPFCQEYNAGPICTLLSSNLLYVSSRSAQLDAETRVIGMIQELIAMNIKPESECYEKSVQAKCHYEMPVCGAPNMDGVRPAHRLCRAECEELYHTCKNDFKDYPSKWNILPICAELDNEYGCTRIGLVPTTQPTTVQTIAPEQSKTQDDLRRLFLHIVLPLSLILILIVITAISAVCIARRRQRSNNRDTPTHDFHDYHGELITDSLKSSQKSSISEVPPENIHFVQELGASHFGKIFKAEIFGLHGNGTKTVAMAKTLCDDYSLEDHKQFYNEISTMSEMKHEHILPLLALGTKSRPYSIMYQYFAAGDLKQFLLSQEAHNTSLEHKESMYILTQIASGLEYLSSKNFVHKDFAARNVVINHNLNIKISVMKVCYGLYSSDYYNLHGKMIPIRWSPTEVITYNQHSLETDIYSYGVLMWEVFSKGCQPFSSFTNEQVIELVSTRQLLSCPLNCPPRIYSLMMECWHEVPAKRPTGVEVHQKMRTWYLDDNNAVYSPGSLNEQMTTTSFAPSQNGSTTPSTNTVTTHLPFNSPQLQSAVNHHNQNQSTPPPSTLVYNNHREAPRMEMPPFYGALYPDSAGLADRGQHYGLRKFSDKSSTSTMCSDSSSEINFRIRPPLPQRR